MAAVDITTYGGPLLDTAYAGMVADLNEASIISRSNESATAIDFGVVVVRGAGDDTIKPIAADTDKILGFSVRHPIQASASVPGATPSVSYKQYDSVPVLEIGRIWVTAGANVTAGNPVYVTAATGALTDASGAGKALVPGAYFDTTATSGNLARVRIAK